MKAMCEQFNCGVLLDYDCILLSNVSNYMVARKTGQLATLGQKRVIIILQINAYEYDKIMSKYSIHNPGSGAAELKGSLWRHFVDTVF